MANGPDAPGIVAGVTRVLADASCNLEDTAMTRLGRHFAMLLMVTSKDDIAAEVLADALSAGTSRFGLHVDVDRLPDDDDGGPTMSGDRWAISVYGADHPGIVAGVTGYLHQAGVNVEDLSTRLVGRDGEPLYTMLIDVTVPSTVEAASLVAGLTQLGTSEGVTCRAHPIDTETL